MTLYKCVGSSNVLTKSDRLVFHTVAELSEAGRTQLCFASQRTMAEESGVSLTALKRSLQRLTDVGAIIKHDRRGKRPSYFLPERVTLAMIYAMEPMAHLSKTVIDHLVKLFEMNDWLAEKVELLRKKMTKAKRWAKRAEAKAEPATATPLHPPVGPCGASCDGSKNGPATERETLERASGLASDLLHMVRRRRTDRSIGDALSSDEVLETQRKRAESRRRKRLGNIVPEPPKEEQKYVAGSITADVDQWSNSRLLHYVMHRAHIHGVMMWSNSRGQHSFEKPLKIQPKFISQFTKLVDVLIANGYRTRYDQAQMFDAWFANWTRFLGDLPKTRCDHFNPIYWMKAWDQAGEVVRLFYRPKSKDEMIARAKELETTVDHEGIMQAPLPADLEQAANRIKRAEQTGEYDYQHLAELLHSVDSSWYSPDQISKEDLKGIVTQCRLFPEQTDRQTLENVALYLGKSKHHGLTSFETYRLSQRLQQHLK